MGGVMGIGGQGGSGAWGHGDRGSGGGGSGAWGHGDRGSGGGGVVRGVIGIGVRVGVARGVTGGGARSEKGKRGPDPANLLMHVLTEHPRHRG